MSERASEWSRQIGSDLAERFRRLSGQIRATLHLSLGFIQIRFSLCLMSCTAFSASDFICVRRSWSAFNRGAATSCQGRSFPTRTGLATKLRIPRVIAVDPRFRVTSQSPPLSVHCLLLSRPVDFH